MLATHVQGEEQIDARDIQALVEEILGVINLSMDQS
jgi:hypothetical protein